MGYPENRQAKDRNFLYSYFQISAIEIFHLENGKVVEERLDGDMLGLMQQLGVELKPKEVEK